MRKMMHPFFHDASILVSVGVFLTHRFETVGVFAHFLCVKNAKTPSIWSSEQCAKTLTFSNIYIITEDIAELGLCKYYQAISEDDWLITDIGFDNNFGFVD